MVTGNPYSFIPFKAKSIFPDVSACDGIKINIRSRTQYNGYYISFGTDRVPGGGHAMGYKSSLFKEKDVPFGLDFVDIIIPFNEFSSNWDEGSGTFLIIITITITMIGNSCMLPAIFVLTILLFVSFRFNSIALF
jgi:hypothetical protein